MTDTTTTTMPTATLPPFSLPDVSRTDKEITARAELATPAKPAIEGDRVLYVLAEGSHKGEIRGADVTRSWNRTQAGAVNLSVITDFTNDFFMEQKGSDGRLWRTSVPYSETKEPGTWHWGEA